MTANTRDKFTRNHTHDVRNAGSGRSFLVVGLCSLLVLGAATSACRGKSTPSDEDVKKAFSRSYSPIGMGIARIKSFQKTNGQAAEVFGVKYYTADCTAEIEWIGQRLDLGWNWPVGKITTEKSSVTFEMTEKGWKDEEGNIY